MNKKEKKNLIRIILSLVIFLIILILDKLNLFKNINTYIVLSLYLIPYLIIGYDILLKAIKGIKNLRPLDENFLMALATLGAFALRDYSEAVCVIIFYQIGELFQRVAVGKSRQSIKSLMDLRGDSVNKYDSEGNIIKVDPNTINVGEEIIVNPGEKINIDGVIVEGTTMLNTSSLTGESIPMEAQAGDDVKSGVINISSVIKVRTTSLFKDSTASKILELVRVASSKKSKSEDFITKFAKVYTPVVVILALLLACVMPLINLIMHKEILLSVWIYRALTFLVISCPCALVISIPLSFFAGLGGASKSGVLIKGSNYLETLSKVKTIVFDKTGTMTKGVFEVSGIHHSNLKEDDLLFYAAHCQMHSNHPIAKSIIKLYKNKLEQKYVSDVKEISGRGISAIVYNKLVLMGNDKLMKDNNIDYIECHETGTVCHIAIDNKYEGHFLINDVVKPQSHNAIMKLKKLGIKKTVMLTGDRENVANEVKEKLEIDEVYSNLLPQDKLDILEKIIDDTSKNKNDKVAFVGDGINDAAALRRADIGISMGQIGQDAAIESSDVVLMDDNPEKISKAILISKKCIRIVYENIYFAIGVKVICLILGALGIANMWYAIFADVGVMIIAVINAIRALNVRKLN